MDICWAVNPFKCELTDVLEEPEGIAEELLELRSNIEECVVFQNMNLLSFWMSKSAKTWKQQKSYYHLQ